MLLLPLPPPPLPLLLPPLLLLPLVSPLVRVLTAGTTDLVTVIRLVRAIVVVVARHDRDLASQIRRATSSIGHNVSEAFGAQAGNSRVRFETARGSLSSVAPFERVRVPEAHSVSGCGLASPAVGLCTSVRALRWHTAS